MSIFKFTMGTFVSKYCNVLYAVPIFIYWRNRLSVLTSCRLNLFDDYHTLLSRRVSLLASGRF